MDEFTNAALDEARAGAAEGGIPIGAALVDDAEPGDLIVFDEAHHARRRPPRPAIAKAIADGLGVPVDQVRKLYDKAQAAEQNWGP